MRNPLPLALALFCLLACAQPAEAIWFRSESIEWQTDQADAVVIASVRNTQACAGRSEYWDSQLVVCQITECLKGSWSQPVEFQQHYANADHPAGGGDPCARGDRLLLFLSFDTRGIAAKVNNWFALRSLPTVEQAPFPSDQAPYDNLGQLVTEEGALLSLVRSRQGREPRRGLIIQLPLQPWEEEGRGYLHELVMTAEPEFRQRLVDELHSEWESTRCEAAYNLASYPGEETEELLRGLLTDEGVGELGATGATVPYYPVRQAAYRALLVLGVEVAPPVPYYPNADHFSTGFENPAYFPPRDWTADYDPATSWRAWLAPLILALGLPPLGLLLVWRRGRFSLRSLVLVVALVAGLCGLATGPLRTVLAGENVRVELLMWLEGVGPAAVACLAGSLVLTIAVGLALLMRGRRARQEARWPWRPIRATPTNPAISNAGSRRRGR